ncbi:MAG TPA: hypothetical protein VFX97_01770 [Pyrinomonadaceae bacterium]|nr:hypothetical protein [Pyrinomonadaceae bacterium]
MKTVVLLLLGTLVVEVILVVGFVLTKSWWVPVVAPTVAISPSRSTSDAEQILKEKLDNYSKRADDIQKLLSLLLTLTTIYTIAVAVSAYASVQNNLREAEKGIQRLDTIIENSRDVIPKQIEELERQTLYTRRIAVATAISQFPEKKETYKDVQETFVKLLMDMRTGAYATDPMLNQQIAHLYIALERFRDAEQVMTTFIERKRGRGESHDKAITDAFYDRACWRALQWPSADSEKQTGLKRGIRLDLARAFKLDNSLQEEARKDRQFKCLENEDWFKALLR